MRKPNSKLIRAHPDFIQFMNKCKTEMKVTFGFQDIQNPEMTKIFANELDKSFYQKIKKMKEFKY